MNPAVFANEKVEKRSQYSQNPGDRLENANSENSEDTFGRTENANHVQVTI